MRDDITPIEDHPLNKLTALLEEFRADPNDAARFDELRTQFQRAGYHGLTAQLLEVYGATGNDPELTSHALVEAAEIRELLNEEDRAENNLLAALDICAHSLPALAALSSMLFEQERWAEYVDVAEKHIATLRAQDSEEDALAALHSECANVWQFHLNRLDEALEHWLAAWHLRPDDCEPLVAARNVYAALGDVSSTVRFFESEIDIHNRLGRDNQRADVEFLLGCFLRRQSDPATLGHLEAAIALKNDFVAAQQVLAETCSSLPFSEDSENRQRGAQLWRQLATHPSYAEPPQRLDFLRRAMQLDPDDAKTLKALEDALFDANRLHELDDLYLQRLETANDQWRISLLQKRRRLHRDHSLDTEKYVAVLQELHRADAQNYQWVEELKEAYQQREQWKELTNLVIWEIEQSPHDSQKSVTLLLYLANLHQKIDAPDEAAHCYHRILSLDCHNTEALTRYAEYFRSRRDWRGLCELHEFAVDVATTTGSNADNALRRLEEIAEYSEARLGDLDRAIRTWERIEELAPNHPRASDSLRRLHSRQQMFHSLVDGLEREAHEAASPPERCDSLRRLAQVYRERQINPRYAISLYEKILELKPDDSHAIKAVAELYERDNDQAGLAYTMRRRLAVEDEELRATTSANALPPVRDWPITKRTERLKALRRLSAMYSGPLNDVEGTVFACGGILEILPGDRDALAKMESLLENANDVQRLEQTLEYHVAASTAPVEKSRVSRQLAKLGADRGDDQATQRRWEQVLQTSPHDGEALSQLSALYAKGQTWKELADVLERRIVSSDAALSGSSSFIALLHQYADAVDLHLKDENRALSAWLRVLDEVPDDVEAVTRVAALQERCQLWAEYCESLEHLIDLHKNNPSHAAELARKRAGVLEQELGLHGHAAATLEHLLEHLDPRDIDAHQKLRALYEMSEDHSAVARISERELLICDDEDRVKLGHELAVLYRDAMRNPARALQTLRRVQKWAPEQTRVREDIVDLLATLRRWPQFVETLREQLDQEEEPTRRRTLLAKIATCHHEHLANPNEAFRWMRLAHGEAPSTETLQSLADLAEAHSLWPALADVYQRELAGHNSEAESVVATSWKLATLQEHKLKDANAASATLLAAFEKFPSEKEIVAGISRLANTHAHEFQWKALAEALAIQAKTTADPGRTELRLQRASVLEEKLGDVEGAVEELLRAFSTAPEDPSIKNALVAVAQRTEKWSDVLAVETALAERATSTPLRIACLHRKARLVEDKLDDKPRAFRTYLSAFLLDPNSQKTLAALWRLAKDIGDYRESDQKPAPEPPAAHIEDAQQEKTIPRPPMAVVGGKNNTRLPTEELSVDDLIGENEGTNPLPPVIALDTGLRVDATTQLELDDLIDLRVRREHTMVLRTEDLIETLGADTVPSAPERRQAQPGLPPPPPGRAPQGPSLSGMAQSPRKNRRRTPLQTVPPGPIPTLPPTSYSSPWLELATAYSLLRGNDLETKLKWLFLITDVWEKGANDIDRALETLSRALELAPDDLRVRERVRQIAETHDKWDQLCDLYQQAAENCATGQSMAELLHETAAIRSHQGRDDDSETIYRRVLGMRPDDQLARKSLEDLYRRSSRWVDLAASLEERTDPRLGTTTPSNEQPDMLRELVELYRNKLNHPHDAIEAAKRLQKFDSAVYESQTLLASLYQQSGRWRDYVEIQQEIVEANPDPPAAKTALRDIGRVYEQELGLTERATAAYRVVLSRWPTDRATLLDLDRLYSLQRSWPLLDDILRLRLEQEENEKERFELFNRRGTLLLEPLQAPTQAVACFEAALALQPADRDTAEVLVSALLASKQERRAIALLQEQIDHDRPHAAPGDLAARLLRLASIYAEFTGETSQAKTVLDDVLTLVPNHPTALAEMARLADQQNTPGEYGRAKLREAEALEDVDTKVEALLAAGAALRANQENDAARQAYSQVIDLRPYHSGATWALATMVEEAGNYDEAIHILQTRLEVDSVADEERADIYTQLAALSGHLGMASAAEERLLQALQLVPTHRVAILGLADLYQAAKDWQRLEQFLDDILTNHDFSDSAVKAELLRRHAAAAEGCGKSDESYQRLIEADRLQRNDLLIKLALGENRYKARRWREAVLHLSALSKHPRASFHPGEVAEALHHAALAEIRSKRPERAENLYLEALELKPDFPPALHALAEIELDRGATERAAELLTRHASATEEAGERLRLFDALGDMWREQIGDAEKAANCYQAALSAAAPVDVSHVSLIERLLLLQQELRDDAGAGRNAELLSSFATSEEKRSELLLQAASAYRSAGLGELAQEASKRAIEMRPYDLQAAAVASEILDEIHDHDAVATILNRALNHEQESSVGRALQALLWSRLAKAYKKKGDADEAAAACQRSLALAPESDGAMLARKILLSDLTDDSQQETALEYRRAIAANSLALADILDYGQTLRETDPERTDGRCILELAKSLGHVLDEGDTKWLDGHPTSEMSDDQSYGGLVEDNDRAELIADAEDEPLATLTKTIAEAVPLLWDNPEHVLLTNGYVDVERVGTSSEAGAAARFTKVSHALQAPATLVYRCHASNAPPVAVLCCAPPIVVLGPRMFEKTEQHSNEEELRFWLARAAESTRPERLLALGLPRQKFEQLIESIVRLFGPSTEKECAPEDEELRTLLPVRIRKQLTRQLAAGVPLQPSSFVQACQRSVDRAGLIVSGSFEAATKAIATLEREDASARHLTKLVLDRNFFQLRKKLAPR